MNINLQSTCSILKKETDGNAKPFLDKITEQDQHSNVNENNSKITRVVGIQSQTDEMLKPDDQNSEISMQGLHRLREQRNETSFSNEIEMFKTFKSFDETFSEIVSDGKGNKNTVQISKTKFAVDYDAKAKQRAAINAK